jgi:DedD protein
MKQGWSSFMDRRLKERLAGATILVVLIVLIVPELLSGPKRAPPPRPPAGAAEPVRNVTVDLATSKAMPGVETAGVTTPGPATPGSASATSGEDAGLADGLSAAAGTLTPGAATPAASSGEAEVPIRPSATPPTITTLQAQQPAPIENGTSSPRLQGVPRAAAMQTPETHHNWAVQLGSFASRANAEKLQHQLKAKGFAAFVSSSGAGKSLYYRVRVGPMADRAGAERIVVKLKKEGHIASVVAP